MKIAILSLYSGVVERGVENWADNLKEHFKGYHSVDIISAKSEHIDLDTAVETSKLTISRRLFLDYFSLRSMLLAIKISSRISQYDLIVPTNGGWQAILVRFLTWRYGKKMIIFGHSGIGWDDRVNLWSFPNTFVALSQFATFWAKSVNPFIQVIHIPVPIDLTQFSPSGPKAKINLNHPVVLSVGAAIPTKQLDLTIKAVSLVPHLSLILLSSGPEAKKLDELGNKLLPKRYLRLQVPKAEIPNWYRSVDLFTLCPWTNESFPVAYLEALATNLPIVATDDLPRREAVGAAGLYVNPKNTKEYARALTIALSTQWGNKPKSQSNKYSWEAIGYEYNQLLAKI